MTTDKPTITNNYYGPIGQKIDYVERIEAHFDKDMQMQVANAEQVVSAEAGRPADAVTGREATTADEQEELFHFIHPEVEEEEARKVHLQVKRLVSRFDVQEICSYLNDLKGKHKVLLPTCVQNAHDELTRMGMPTDRKGYDYKTFAKYYNK